MKTIYILFMILITLFILTGCGSEQQPHEHEEHESIAVTRWTETSELFMEYEDMTAGRETVFITHLTRLEDFSPVTEGTVTFTFTDKDGKNTDIVTTEPARPGIYLPKTTLQSPGIYTLKLTITGEQLNDVIPVGDVTVHDPSSDNHTHSAASNAEAIPFLKEQQWKIEFKVQQAEIRIMTESFTVIGELREMPGRKAQVTVPVDGLVEPVSENSFFAPGMPVKTGTVMAVLSPLPETRTHISEVLSAYYLAEAEYKRAQRLHEEQAVSGKRLEEAHMNYEALKIEYEVIPWTVERGNEHNPKAEITYQVTAPISGYLESIYLNPGKMVKAGEVLFTIFDPSRIRLIAHVPTNRITKIGSFPNARFTVEGNSSVFGINELNGRLLSRGYSVNKQSRTVPVVFEVDNTADILKVGMSADVTLLTNRQEEALSIPVEAIITEYNNRIAFVQVSGESFVKRILKTGIEDDGYVQILDGIESGERVVFTGAYQVRLASLSSVVPTGHGH